jgi:D-glycero-D-manno-heptose 1,7-bisphosphate phosphatase
MISKRQSVFIDRDGVIIDVVDRGENFFVKGKKARWTAPFKYDEFRVKEGVAEALGKIKALGFLLILVSNQPDIAYGTMSKNDSDKMMKKIKKFPFDDIFVCYHGREEGCDCKKPKPGMLLEAQKKWNIDLNSSYMIGDTANDMTAGKAAGCRCILIDAEYNKDVKSDFRAKSLLEAVKNIC